MYKHVWYEVIREQLLLECLGTPLKISFNTCELKVYLMKVFPQNMLEATDFTSSGQAYT